MTPIQDCILNKNHKINPIWIMRQAGRYLPEFREIRSKNPDFIKLCLNENLSSKITLQPIKRFDFDAAIIFSDILMLPYGLGQEVKFEKGLGPKLGKLDLDLIGNVSKDKFSEKLNPIYKSISNISSNIICKNKDIIGFVGAPWTILVYMINKMSPKKSLSKEIFNDKLFINKLLSIIEKCELLNPAGMIILEHRSNENINDTLINIERFDVRKYGDTQISFYKKIN